MAGRWDRYPLDDTPAKGGNAFKTWSGTPQLPDKVDLRNEFAPVTDVGPDLRASAAFAMASVGEFILRRSPWRGTYQRLSPLYTYYFGRSVGQLQDSPDAGISILDALSGLTAYGGCPEALWPYDPTKYRTRPPQSCRDAAIELAIINIVDPWTTAEGVMRCLADGNPVVFRYVGPQDQLRQAGATGRMPQPTAVIDVNLDAPGHAMVVVGYDLRERTLIVRNCWGADWGAGGHVMMPLDLYNMTSPNAVAMGVIVVEDRAAASSAAPHASPPPSSGLDAGEIRKSIRTELQSDVDDAIKSIRDRFKKPGQP
jgi:hypothetical protein